MNAERKLNVLVVDDHADQARRVQQVLGRYGCEVVIAISIDEALASFQAGKPDLVLIDLQLTAGGETMEGVELAEAIREEDSTIPIAFVSSLFGDVPLERMQRIANVLDLIVKPVNWGSVFSVVDRARGLLDGNRAA